MFEEYLPTPPPNHHYRIETVSKMITKVWLHRNEPSQLLEKEIYTIYCFIKGSKNPKVHKPKNAKECYVKSYCELDELKDQGPYSLYVTEVTSLQHLL